LELFHHLGGNNCSGLARKGEEGHAIAITTLGVLRRETLADQCRGHFAGRGSLAGRKAFDCGEDVIFNVESRSDSLMLPHHASVVKVTWPANVFSELK
jgi:hypothetical protein